MPGFGMGMGDSQNLMQQMYGQSPYQSFLQNRLPGVPQGAQLPEGFRNSFTPPAFDWLEGIKKRAQAELKKKRRNVRRNTVSRSDFAGGRDK